MAARWPRYRSSHSRILVVMLVAALGIVAGPSSSWAQDDGCITAQQAHRSWRIEPLTGEEIPESFYAYHDFRSHNPLVKDEASVLFFYAPGGQSCGDLSLFMLHHTDRPAQARLTFSGVPDRAILRLKDDPDDAYWLSPPSMKITWRWSADRTDGAVVSGLQGDVFLMVQPEFDAAIKTWYLIGGGPDGPRFVELSSLSEPLRLRFLAPTPIARFRMSPESPTVGQDVRFDASASSASQAEIAQYRWDFDADGAFELNTPSPVVTHRFGSASPHRATLEVVDSAGRVGRASRAFDVHTGEFSVDRRVLTNLPAHQALPGSTVTVELRIQARGAVSGVGIRETVPEQWTIKPVTTSGLAYNAARREWILLEALEPGAQRRVQYHLAIPEEAVRQTYEIAGRAVSSSPDFQAAIGGDREIAVVDALPVELAISRLAPDGALDVTLSNLISFDQVLQAVALWQADAAVPGTNGERLDLTLMARLVAYWLNDRPVTEPLP